MGDSKRRSAFSLSMQQGGYGYQQQSSQGYGGGYGSGGTGYQQGSTGSGAPGFNDQGFLASNYNSNDNAAYKNYGPPPTAYGGGGTAYGSDNMQRVPSTTSFEDEPPLLEELGINFDHIIRKTLTVCHPFKKMNPELADDQDLCGPIIFAMALGAALLLRGKLHFGYIYGLGVIGCIGIWFVLNLLSQNGLSLCHAISILGYSLLPMVGMAFGAMVLKGVALYACAALTVAWCSTSAARMVCGPTQQSDQVLLVTYPVGLL